jgi:hypothetical protein
MYALLPSLPTLFFANIVEGRQEHLKSGNLQQGMSRSFQFPFPRFPQNLSPTPLCETQVLHPTTTEILLHSQFLNIS